MLAAPSNFAGFLGLSGHMLCPFDPMELETNALLAHEKGGSHEEISAALALWDNIHIKARVGPIDDPVTGKPHETPYVFYPQGNDVLDVRDANLCFHLHERWPDSEAAGRNFGRGQVVRYLVLGNHAGEADPPDPEALADSRDSIASGDLALWLVSEASSRRCSPPNGKDEPGPVNNTNRPCRAFASPIFTSGPNAAPPVEAVPVASGFSDPWDIFPTDTSDPASCAETPVDDKCKQNFYFCPCPSAACDAGCTGASPGLHSTCEAGAGLCNCICTVGSKGDDYCTTICKERYTNQKVKGICSGTFGQGGGNTFGGCDCVPTL